MSKRGPKPTPTPILKLHGSWRATRRGTLDAIDQKKPACPKRFITKQKNEDGEAVRLVAKRTWDHLAPILHKAGLLVASYREPFEALCDSYGRFILACSKCDSEGMTTTGAAGSAIKNPWFAVRNQMWDQLYKGAACFGLTPADLSGVHALEKPTDEKTKMQYFKEA